MLGFQGANGNPFFLVTWIAVCFVSILIHELGHTLMMRYFGGSPRIVLHAMGGLAIQDSWGMGQRRSWTSQILISAAGPGIQLLLAALVCLAVVLAGGYVDFHFKSIVFWNFDLSRDVPTLLTGNDIPSSKELLYVMVWDLLLVNFLWAMLNLLPVLPLDGGQIAREVIVKYDPLNGQYRALMLSVFTGGGIALYAIINNDFFLAIMFGLLAYQSYQQANGGRGMGGGMGGGRPW